VGGGSTTFGVWGRWWGQVMVALSQVRVLTPIAVSQESRCFIRSIARQLCRLLENPVPNPEITPSILDWRPAHAT
jgi:hypothetical protein